MYMSNNKDLLISYIHKLLREDSYTNNLFASIGEIFDDLDETLNKLSSEFLFSTMTAERVKELEKELSYTTNAKTLEGKRIEIEARWKTSGKCDLELLQAIANSWRNGEIEIKFIDGTIEIIFISLIGIPNDIEVLKASLEEAKPAHLGINFQYKYRLWKDLPPKTWEYYNQFTWQEVMKKEGI